MTRDERRRTTSEEMAGATRMPPMAQQWLAPRGVRATDSGDGVEWLPHESLEHRGRIEPQQGLLEHFVSLADADSAGVADFAQIHGVLGLWTEGRYGPGEYAREPLSVWHD